jgi:hypothetical protein
VPAPYYLTWLLDHKTKQDTFAKSLTQKISVHFAVIPTHRIDMKEATGECNVYWSEDDVLNGNWIVMPTLRIAKLHHICKDSGRRVFITANSKLVCEHGECASSIGSWVSAEQRASLEGKDTPPRNSICDCSNTDGMHWTKSMPEPKVTVDPPADTLFDVLDCLDTHKVVVRGHALRHIPHTCGTSALFVSQKGGLLCCRHGHSLNVLRAMQNGKPTKFRGGVCRCRPCAPPRRVLGLQKPSIVR